MLCICCSVNGDQVMLLTSSIYKHMKRAATQLFNRQSKKVSKYLFATKVKELQLNNKV